jgi:hypothetical protein
MDLRLYFGVIWRFKLIVVMGLVLALSLAILSVVRIGSSGFVYRQSELWSSTTRLGVTQNGFPWGRLFAQTAGANGTSTPVESANKAGDIPIADPNRFTDLAIFYAEMATSDPVRRLLLREGPIRGKIIAAPVVVQDNITLPLIDLTAIATSPQGAKSLAQRGANALDTYLRTQQAANNVPSTDRVILQQLLIPRKAKIFAPRSKTMPIVIFLAVMFATIALAFLLENLRPRTRGVPEGRPLEQQEFQGPARRTA